MAATIVLKRCFPVASKYNILKRVYLIPSRIMSSAGDYVVEHNRMKNQFYISIGKEKAVLQYEILDPFTLELWHTEVPDAFRGKGVAKLLAEAAMNYVVNEDLKMDVSCTYLQKYLKENPNPDYIARLVKR